jgi:rsbT co-antagonist protein RsbR
MSAPTRHVLVPFDRIQRVIDILSMVSIGEYSPEMIQIPAGENADEFSVLEAALNIYNQELASARSQNEQYIAELERSKQELQEQIATIARQQLAIHELSSPIAEVWEDILLLPVIGSLDSQRALEMTEKLLERIKQTRSACVIIDITGVELVDTNTASAMLKMTRSARLLGAVCVLTGVRPEIARTMAQLNIEVEGVRTLRTLKDGLRACFDLLRRRRERRKKSLSASDGAGLGIRSAQSSAAPQPSREDAAVAAQAAEAPVTLAALAEGGGSIGADAMSSPGERFGRGNPS